jgi:hypothetical protein
MAKARRLNHQRYRLPAVGASVHTSGRPLAVPTRFKGATASELRAAFATGSISAHEGRFPSLREVGLAKTLALPIAGLRATPKQLGWRRTAWSFVSRYWARASLNKNKEPGTGGSPVPCSMFLVLVPGVACGVGLEDRSGLAL